MADDEYDLWDTLNLQPGASLEEVHSLSWHQKTGMDETSGKSPVVGSQEFQCGLGEMNFFLQTYLFKDTDYTTYYQWLFLVPLTGGR